MLVDWAGSFFKTKKSRKNSTLSASGKSFRIFFWNSFGNLLECRFRRSKSGSARKAPLGVAVNVLDARLAQKSRDALKFLKAHGH